MKVRKAMQKDCLRMLELLAEIGDFHYAGRPDIFRVDAGKYDLTELSKMVEDVTKPIFVSADEKDEVLGYAMCQIKENAAHPVLAPYKVLYLDDLCVDEKARKTGIGDQLLETVKDFGREMGCSRIELNVWEFPGSAQTFYEREGFTTQRRFMEFWL